MPVSLLCLSLALEYNTNHLLDLPCCYPWAELFAFNFLMTVYTLDGDIGTSLSVILAPEILRSMPVSLGQTTGLNQTGPYLG